VAATKNLKIYKGDSYSLLLRVRSTVWDEEQGAFVPSDYVNLTGKIARAQIRPEAGHTGEPLAEFTCTIPSQAVESNYGTILLTLTPAQTAALTSAAMWDIQIQNADATDVHTYLRGTVTSEDQVTI
jgi:hypothetical protein